MFFVRAMSTPDAMIPSAAAADPDDRQANHAWRMRMLEIAAERGVELLDDLRDRARERAEDDIGLSYSRIARAIRQSVVLHARFEEEFHKSAEQKAAEAAQRAAQAEAGRRARQKRQVKRAVTLAMDLDCDAAEARGEEARDYGEFTFELHERLDDYDEYSDFGRLPIGAVVENICRVMGLTFDPALWQDEPWAVTEMDEKPDGSPYAEWDPEAPETANDDDEPDEEADDPCGLAEEADEPPRRRSQGPPWAAE